MFKLDGRVKGLILTQHSISSYAQIPSEHPPRHSYLSEGKEFKCCISTVGIHTAPIPEWTVREQLVLASAVQRSGDQNWCVRG